MWYVIWFHLFEHFTQIIQVYILGWERSQSLGIIGLLFPILIRSEILHYLFSLFNVIFFLPLARQNTYYYTATILAILHHNEHFGLLLQSIFKEYWFGGNKPMTFLEQFIPRIELHFIYNLIVLSPIIVCHIKCREKY
ncbi:hypothetical protein AA637_11890 [Cyanobacterium sp. HL-69]|nr:hypothetical protein AA637_11890 [Cyanobacterium sp. HL-69]